MTISIDMDPTPEQVLAFAHDLSSLAQKVATSSDPMSKKVATQSLILKAKQLICEIQDPLDVVMDQISCAYTISSILALSEIGVFEALPRNTTMGSRELAVKCNADEELIVRLMRQLTCVNIFTEVTLSHWAHNRLSIGLSTHAGMTGKLFYGVCFDEMWPCMSVFHRYLREFGKKDILTYTETPHSWYNQMMGKNFWEVLGSSPQRSANFNKGLSLFDALHPVVAMFPFEQALKEGNSLDRVLVVDIAGGRGGAMKELQKGCPGLQGEIILQDRAEVLAELTAEDLPGVTTMPHDFFTEQPVKNAQVYYLRRVLHDWQDEEASKILKAIVPAMGPDSRILISDMTIPEPVTAKDQGAVWLDLMLMSIGGKERTQRDWERLADLTDLSLVKIWQELDKYGPLCVVEYVLKKEENGGKLTTVTKLSNDTVENAEEENSRVDDGGRCENEQEPDPRLAKDDVVLENAFKHLEINCGNGIAA